MAGDAGTASSKLSEVMGAALHRAAVASAPHLQAAHDERITTFLEGLEARVAPLLAPILEDVLSHPDTPPEVRELLGVVASPTHKFDSSLIGIGLAAILYPFIQAAVLPFVTRIGYGAWDGDPLLLLSPPELALAVIKHTYDPTRAAHDARFQGLTGELFQVMVDNTGEPIAIAELLQALRRGIIDDTRLAHGVHQSRVRDEWLDVITALRYAPPPAGEVVAGRVKEHLTDADYRTKLSEAGTDPANAEWMRLTAGRPYGIEQALHLLNRGAIDEARVRQVVAQSDVNTDFYNDILQLRFYVPPVRSVMAMLRAGAITDAQATTLFTENGVRAADIAGYLAEAHHSKASGVKQLSEAQTLRMYGAKFIDAATATNRLQTLGYDPTTITELLGFADEAQHERYVNAVVTRVHARFVAYKLTESEARAALAADKVPAAAVNDLVALWHIERDANIHTLTPAAIVGAYRRQQISAAETKARLLAAGVQLADLAIVVADGFTPSKPNPAAVAAVVNA